MVIEGKKSRLKIGYMPLAHKIYWKFFPNHEESALALARRLKNYLGQFGTIYETGQLIDSMTRAKEARLLFQANDVDVLILATVTYSTPDDVLLDLKKYNRPIIIWNTQKSSSIPTNLDFNKWMLEHGVTGVAGLTRLFLQENFPCFLISGHLSSEAVKQMFSTTLEAVAAAKHLWGAKIGLFGHVYPGMMDFGYDPTSMFSKFGVSTVQIVETLVLNAYKAVAGKHIAALEKELLAKYTMADKFQGKEFTNSLRVALAMRQIVRDKKLDAATIYCQLIWQNPEIGVVPCIGNSLLMQDGIFFTCEGDVPTALAGMMLEYLSGNKGIFTEIWVNDFDKDQFLMGHSGQMNLGLFEDNTKSVKLNRHPWWDGCCGRGISLSVKMPPGKVTMLNISLKDNGKWWMIASMADVLDREPTPLGAPNFFMKMNKPISKFIEEWGEAGAAHHFAMAYGDWTSHLKALAKIFDIEYRFI